MMNRAMNKVELIGNLGHEPELREFEGGKRVTRLRLATNERFTYSDGQTKEDTQWHSVVAWGRLAEEAVQALSKGCRLFVEGRLVHRTWEAKDGQKRYSTEVVMSRFERIEESDERPGSVLQDPTGHALAR